MVRLALSADIHSPKYFAKFKEEFSRVVSAFDLDYVVLAGDLINRGDVSKLGMVEELVGKHPVYAVPGNEEYDSVFEELRRSRIKFIFDEVVQLSSSPKVKLVGSRGCLAKPTRWQREHVPNIAKVYEERRTKLLEMTAEALNHADLVVVVTHYATSKATLSGEDPLIWPMLGVELAERFNDRRILYVHGHAHNSRVRCAYVGSSLVLNVSFPNLWRVFVVELGNGFKILYPELECKGGSLLKFLTSR